MTTRIRRDAEISDVDGGWFRARWHFSFDSYHDPEYMQFGTLRVFNDDRLVPGAIWPMHPHKDIEGLTYVVEGSFRHEDDVGGAPGPLPAGSVQRMTLGRGAFHSEQNASETEPMRFIQIWIMPAERGLPPGRGAYLYLIEGDVGMNGERMETGSAAQITDEERVEIAASSASELILVDVALG